MQKYLVFNPYTGLYAKHDDFKSACISRDEIVKTQLDDLNKLIRVQYENTIDGFSVLLEVDPIDGTPIQPENPNLT